MKINWKYFLLFFFLFALFGYFREKFFVSLNHLLYIKYYGHNTDLPLDKFILFLDDYSYSTLYYLKYPATILSVSIFGTLSFLSIKFILNEKKILRWIVYSYLILLTLAGLSMLFGYLVNQRLQDDEYTLSRWLVGIAQSPIITIVILASHQLYKQQTKTTEPWKKIPSSSNTSKKKTNAK